MNTSMIRRPGAPAGAVRASEISAAISALALVLSTAALAQTETPAATDKTAEEQKADQQTAEDQRQAEEAKSAGAIDTVLVTGIRAAIESAIAIKKDAGQIVEAVSAEDIGKLPDTSIAESISRLPGITSQRANGRASAVSIRGTDPGFATALLNGREQVSTGDNRNIEFDQYPSELLSAVVVYKTPDAGLIGQGLSGTIDLRTIRPLDYGRRAMAFNIRGERNSQDDLGSNSKSNGYRASFSYIDQFADNHIGLAFGYARLYSPLDSQETGTYNWSTNTPGLAGVHSAQGFKVLAGTGDETRDGWITTLQFQPNETYSSALDLYYAKSNRDNDRRSIEVNMSGYPAAVTYSNPVVVDGALVAADFTNANPLARNFLYKRNDDILATGWRNELQLGAWNVVGDLSYSYSERKEDQLETQAQIFPQTFDSGSFSVFQDEAIHLRFNDDYADPATVQVGPTIYGPAYLKFPHIKDKLKSARLDFGHDLGGWFSTFQFGANYADREKYKNQPETGAGTTGNNWFPVADNLRAGDAHLDFAGSPSTLSWDVPGVLATYFDPFTPSDDAAAYLVQKAWTVNEELLTGYAKVNLDHPISDRVELKGNIGLQVIDTDQSSDALFWDNTIPGPVPVTVGKTYTDVLPSLNLAFQLPSEQVVRLGIAKVLARPRMDHLRAAVEIGIDTTLRRPGASGGNPRLDPWRANAFDLAYEKYFADHAYVAGAVFYKDLKSYIFQQTSLYDFAPYVADIPRCQASDPPGTTCLDTTIGPLTGAFNGQGGHLKGVELTASLPGEMLASALEGFGVVASFSYTDSQITIADNPFDSGGVGTDAPLPGLSKRVTNVTVYYEKNGFSARAAMRQRSNYLGEVPDFANERAFKFVKGDRVIDFQTGYEFQPGGFLEGWSVLFQVNNLTNEPYTAYQEIETQVIDYQQYGRQYLLGVNYKL